MAQTAAEALIEQGIEQGARQMSIESTLLILTEKRFPNDEVLTVQPRLEAITDLDRLRTGEPYRFDCRKLFLPSESS